MTIDIEGQPAARFVLGARSLSFITHVDPRMVAVAQKAIELTTQDFGFTEEQSRTMAQEAEKVREGFSHTMHSHHIIDCEPGWSAPGTSGAVDAVPWNGTAFVWDWNLIYPIAAAFKAASIQLNIPITWGGGSWGKLMTEYAGDDAAAMQAEHGIGGGFDGPHYELGRN
jgi:peptidoglycan LD-endopeptidase CwlK